MPEAGPWAVCGSFAWKDVISGLGSRRGARGRAVKVAGPSCRSSAGKACALEAASAGLFN
jgi:hypothetical protein